MFALMTFFLQLVLQTQNVFLDFEHYLEIINLLYLNQKPVDFDKTFRFQYRIKK